MKVRLLCRDRDLQREETPPPESEQVTADLGLDWIIGAMAGRDAYLEKTCRQIMFTSLVDPDAIRYRQAVVEDALDHPGIIRDMHLLAAETVLETRRRWWVSTRYPDSLLRGSGAQLEYMLSALRRLRETGATERGGFRSEGFRRWFDELLAELDESYLATAAATLAKVRPSDGDVLSARLGEGNRGDGYLPRWRPKRTWRERLGLLEPGTYRYELHPRDDAGVHALTEIGHRGIAQSADALGRSSSHVLGWFQQLRFELAFLIGCLNLRDALRAVDAPVSMPQVAALGDPALSATGLIDPALALSSGGRVVGNDVAADGCNLVLVTGANRGGKSTFLRSVGLAQLMTQAGMFVAAERLHIDARSGLFTHFKREEDAELKSGKLEEELIRMSRIVDQIQPGGILLLNESFASTNEREGSQIGRGVIDALLTAGIKVVCVTHLHALAAGLRRAERTDACFLRAERLPDGRRTFRVVPGDPLATSHGQDVYHEVFGDRKEIERTGGFDRRAAAR